MVRRPRRGDGGKATVELAIALPIVLMVLLVIVQAGLVIRTQLLVTHAAREGARVAAVGEDPMAAAVASSDLDPSRMRIDRSGGSAPGEMVTVTITYQAPTNVPLVGQLVDDVSLTAEATMRIEG